MTRLSIFKRQLVAIVGSLVMSSVAVGFAVGPAEVGARETPVALYA